MYRRVFYFIAGVQFAAALAQAQVASPAPKQQGTVAVSQQKGDWELGLFSGAVISPVGSDTSVGGGANIAYALNTYLYPFFEFSVLPGGFSAVNSQTQFTSGASAFRIVGDAADFHGGFHIRIPMGKRFVPYGVIGFGGYKPYNVQIQELYQGNVIGSNPIKGSTQFAVNYGGGIRYYITNHVGVRFETTAYGPSGNFNGTPVRVMAGVFFQFKKKDI